jgi:hypothetical protein
LKKELEEIKFLRKRSEVADETSEENDIKKK